MWPYDFMTFSPLEQLAIEFHPLHPLLVIAQSLNTWIPLFFCNQETDQLEYLVPEKSSLRRHLRCPDPQFVDFLSYLLQINPRKRPTASEALEHPWLSSEY
jgi:serine/threonine protein kinase